MTYELSQFSLFCHHLMHSDRNILQIENATRGIRLKFCAEDALVAWAARHNEKTISSPPSSDANSVGYNQPSHDDISVPYASKFQEGIQENIRRLKGWDWTFCSDYCGSISEIDTCRNEGSFQINNAYQVKDDNGMIDRYIMNPRILNQIATNSYSSSCSTSYKIRMLENNGEVGIDFDILRKREDILFFDEAVLYQGDLEDCGEVIFDYKVRVMPSCWFVLVRLFLRVDNAETRIRSYRYYHNFDSNKIDLNISWQVGSAEKMKEFRDAQLAENTTRLQIPTRSSPSTAATPGGVFRGVGGAPDLPAEVVANNFLRDANKLSEILPSVNDIEIIPQNVVLEFR